MIGFFKRKGIKLSFKTYFIDALGAMALGLFASLLIGTIFGTVYDKTGLEFFKTMKEYASAATGPAMAIAIGSALGAPQLVLLSLCAVGCASNTLGGPMGTFFAVVVAAECGKIVSKETKIDILVTPSVTIAAGTGIALLTGPGISYVMTSLGNFIMTCTELQPFWMGRHLPHSADKLGSNLRITRPGRTRRRCGNSRLLRPDDRLRGDEFPRERFKRSARTRLGYKYAADG